MPLPKLAAASALSQQHPVWLCDVWGVVHNGAAAIPEACDALIRHRRGGVACCWLQCAALLAAGGGAVRSPGVPREIYDRVLSSGDVTRGLIEMRAGQSIFHWVLIAIMT